MQRDLAVYNRLYTEHFTTAQPCRTTLGITALPTPIAIELKCVAALEGARPLTGSDSSAMTGVAAARPAPFPAGAVR